MKPTGVILNLGRGPIIDEVALAKALQEKWLGFISELEPCEWNLSAIGQRQSGVGRIMELNQKRPPNRIDQGTWFSRIRHRLPDRILRPAIRETVLLALISREAKQVPTWPPTLVVPISNSLTNHSAPRQRVFQSARRVLPDRR